MTEEAMKLRLLTLIMTLILLPAIVGCDFDPETVKKGIKDPCVTATRDFVKLELQALSLFDSCIIDLHRGYCNIVECLLWIQVGLPDECQDQGYGFLKSGGACGECPDPTSMKLRHAMLRSMCLEVARLYDEQNLEE
jgi:hypothetical protein